MVSVAYLEQQKQGSYWPLSILVWELAHHCEAHEGNLPKRWNDYCEKNYTNNLRGDKSLIIAMKSMNAADITTQHDNLFKFWFCVLPKSIFTFRSSVEIRN